KSSITSRRRHGTPLPERGVSGSELLRSAPPLSRSSACPEGDPPCARRRGLPHAGHVSLRREPSREASRRYQTAAVRVGFLQRERPRVNAHGGRLLWPQRAPCRGPVARRRRDQALIVRVSQGRQLASPSRNNLRFS